MRPLILIALSAAILPVSARSATVETRATWSSYTEGLAMPGNAVAGAVGLDFRSPLVAGSLSEVMALQPALSPEAFAAESASDQAAAIRGAIRVLAAPVTEHAPLGVNPARVLKSDVLVQIEALSGALPETERRAVAASVKAELERRGESLTEAVRRVSANFEMRRPEDLPVIANVSAMGNSRPSGLKPYDPATRVKEARLRIESPAETAETWRIVPADIKALFRRDLPFMAAFSALGAFTVGLQLLALLPIAILAASAMFWAARVALYPRLTSAERILFIAASVLCQAAILAGTTLALIHSAPLWLRSPEPWAGMLALITMAELFHHFVYQVVTYGRRASVSDRLGGFVGQEIRKMIRKARSRTPDQN